MVDDIATIRYETFTADIYLPGLHKWRTDRLKKLFKLLRKGIDVYGYPENVEAKEKIQKTLDTFSADAKENWRFTSEVYQREYIAPDYHFQRNSKLWKEATRFNKRLMADVKKAKREYDRAEKLKQYFSDIVN